MAAVRKLPACEHLLALVEQGKTNRQIAEMYGTTYEAVRQALLRCGYTRGEEKPNTKLYLPWTIRADHYSSGRGEVLVRYLRALAKREQGIQLSEKDSQWLSNWLAFMEGDNKTGRPLAVHYARTEGFWLEVRREGEGIVSPPPEADRT